ncbi:MAG: hypothetical protein JW839_14545 [Candidatus Lokiarchaeota archaeon]|nr:hypothetical protein [Candidatus Lokiarchaeota archaeon]
MSLSFAAIRISIVLGIVGSVLAIILLFKGRIARWWRNHSRDVPLEQEYLALKEKIKDASFRKKRIVEFYVLVGGGIALSLLIYIFAEDMPIYNTATLVFWSMFGLSSIGFAVVAVAGAWAFKKKALRVLIQLRFFTGLMVTWMLVYFVSYAVWPLYLLRYAYDVIGAGLLAAAFPGSQTYVDFPVYGFSWQGMIYGMEIAINTVHPLLWGAFVGIGLFIPGQSVASKVKKGLLLFVLDHIACILIIFVDQILYIDAKIESYGLPTASMAFAIKDIIGAAWRAVAIFALYPDTRALARSLVRGALKADPIHAVFPNEVEDEVRRQFIADGGQELDGNDELKQRNQRWGIAMKVDAEHELHVRARGHGPGHFSLSAHYEYGRDSGKHLLAAGDYKAGKRILADYLARKGFNNRTG